MAKKGHTSKASYLSILIKASEKYGNDSAQGFKLFDSKAYGDKADLLFKDSTVRLQDASGKSYSEFLGKAYMDDLEALEDCKPTVGGMENMPYFVGSFVVSLVTLMLVI